MAGAKESVLQSVLEAQVQCRQRLARGPQEPFRGSEAPIDELSTNANHASHQDSNGAASDHVGKERTSLDLLDQAADSGTDDRAGDDEAKRSNRFADDGFVVKRSLRIESCRRLGGLVRASTPMRAQAGGLGKRAPQLRMEAPAGRGRSGDRFSRLAQQSPFGVPYLLPLTRCTRGLLPTHRSARGRLPLGGREPMIQIGGRW